MLTELIISGLVIPSGPVPHTGDLYLPMPDPICVLHNEQGAAQSFPVPDGVSVFASVSFTAGSVERIDFEVYDNGYIFYAWSNSGVFPGDNPCVLAVSPLAPRFFGPVDLWTLSDSAVVTFSHNEQGDLTVQCRVGVEPATPDFNFDGAVDSQDYFDFVASFLNGMPSTDWNRNGAVNSQDFFDFLTAFLSA